MGDDRPLVSHVAGQSAPSLSATRKANLHQIVVRILLLVDSKNTEVVME